MSPGFIYSVLVPVDFTRQSVWALSAAAIIARKNQGIIYLLHVVDSRTSPEKETIEDLRIKLFEFARDHQQELGVSIIPKIEIGNIFRTIGEKANRLGVKLIVMGTHGIKGIQKVIGSYAIRVVMGSKVPVILIKDQFPSESFSKVIIPFDTNTSIDLVIEKIIKPGRPFQGTIYLFSLERAMSSFRKRKFMGRIKRALNKLLSEGLESKSIILQNDMQDFTDSIIRYARNINADIIAIPLYTKNSGKDFEISDISQNLFTKASLPLWIMNPKKM